jgi:hypothetical protein
MNERLYAVASILGRQLKEDTELGGYEIPKGVEHLNYNFFYVILFIK